jgi:hypothetical protein
MQIIETAMYCFSAELISESVSTSLDLFLDLEIVCRCW